MKKPLVYIAGPYSGGDPVVNTQRAIAYAENLYRSDLVVPFIPHLSIAWHLASPHPLEFWYAYDLEVLRHCDAVFRIKGDSHGADLEVEEANRLGIPVFYQTHPLQRGMENLLSWAKQQKAKCEA